MSTTHMSRHTIDTQFNGITALTVRATSNRLGSRGWRLHDTPNGRAIKRTRNGRVVSNRTHTERVLPVLDDETQERLARELTSKRANTNINIHDK